MIIATAGHVDHGKTSLVRALTGIDTDRLPEEKRRGMSIDLGFAYLPMPGREPIAFVDVPGHERFVRNMAAGVGGVDLALLVVAADDGPMPQTREHLAILEHLGVPRLLAVLSKIDRVPTQRVAEADLELRSVLDQGNFRGSDVLPVSSVTGEGLEALRERLSALADDLLPRATTQRFRMNVDRAFVIVGLGLVATGTILSGAVGLGNEVQILPAGRKARVRSLRANNGQAERAVAGQRCALALHGISRAEVGRGDVIAEAGPAPVSKHLDVDVTWLESPLVRPATMGVHLGTAMLQARLSPLGRFARLSFPQGVSAWHGDRLLLRNPGSQRLIAAGVVVDPLPPERGAARRERLALLECIAGHGAEKALETLLADGMVNMEWFVKVFHLAPRDEPGTVTFPVRGARHVMRKEIWDAKCDALERTLSDWHAAHPDSVGPRSADLGAPLPAMIDALVDGGRLVREGPSLRKPGHWPVLSAQDEALWQKFAPLLEGQSGRPPRVHELAAGLKPVLLALHDRPARRPSRVVA